MSPFASRLLKSSAAALLVKIGGAGLSYLMFVALAQAMTPLQFGYFSVAFGVASILAKCAVGGQQSVALRDLSRVADDAGAQAQAQREQITTRGYVTVLLLSAILCLGLCAFVLATQDAAGAGAAALLVAALFIPVMALSELQTSILRAYGAVVQALAPREVVWRGLVCVACFGIVLQFGAVMSASEGFLLCVVLLALATLGQSFASPRLHVWRQQVRWHSLRDRDWQKVSAQFFTTSVITFGAPMLSVVVIGVFLSPLAAGAFFAALKTAQVINLLLIATNLVASPLISQAYGKADKPRMQLICAQCSGAGAAFAALAFLLLAISGEWVLGIFGQGYEQAYWPMMILAGAYVLNAACGPNGVVLEMTKHQDTFLRIMVIANGLGIVALPLATWAFGSVGAALAVAGTLVLWNLLAVRACNRLVGVNPSALSLLSVLTNRAGRLT